MAKMTGLSSLIVYKSKRVDTLPKTVTGVGSLRLKSKLADQTPKVAVKPKVSDPQNGDIRNHNYYERFHYPWFEDAVKNEGYEGDGIIPSTFLNKIFLTIAGWFAKSTVTKTADVTVEKVAEKYAVGVEKKEPLPENVICKKKLEGHQLVIFLKMPVDGLHIEDVEIVLDIENSFLLVEASSTSTEDVKPEAYFYRIPLPKGDFKNAAAECHIDDTGDLQVVLKYPGLIVLKHKG